MAESLSGGLEMQSMRMRAEQLQHRNGLARLQEEIGRCNRQRESIAHALGREIAAGRMRAETGPPGRWRALLSSSERALMARRARELAACEQRAGELSARRAGLQESAAVVARKLERVEVLLGERKAALRKERRSAAEEQEMEALMLSNVRSHSTLAIPAPEIEASVNVTARSAGQGPGDTAGAFAHASTYETSDPAALEPHPQPLSGEAASAPRFASIPTSAQPSVIREAPKGEVSAMNLWKGCGSSPGMLFEYLTAGGSRVQIAVAHAANRLFVNLQADSVADRSKLVAQRREIVQSLRSAGISVGDISFRSPGRAR